jgi:GT2 family glycosyltransferase
LATDFAGRPLRTLKPPTEHEEIDRQHLLGEGGGVLNPSACMRRSAVQEVGGFRDQFPPSEDFDLLLRLAEIGCLANLPEVLVEYRLHAQSATFQRREEMITHAHLALIEACTRRKIEAPDDAVLQTHLDLGPGDLDLLWARWANKDRFFSTARLYASKSVRNDIRDFARWRELAIALFPPPISNRPFGRLFLKPAIGFARWSFLTMAHAIARPTSGSSSLT